MTEANVTSVVITSAVVGEGEKQVSSTPVSVGLMGIPGAMASSIVANVATGSPSPPLQISAVAVCVLRNPYLKHSFQAIWVE